MTENQTEGGTSKIKPLRVVMKPVIRKSQAGVEYTHYVPTIEGKQEPARPNRLARRRQAAYERSAAFRKALKKKAK